MKAQGKPLYHGSPTDRLNTGIKGDYATPSDAGKGIYFTDDPVRASDYANVGSYKEGYRGSVTRAHLIMKNPLEIEGKFIDKKIVADAKAKGFDGIINKNVEGIRGYNEYVVFDPSQIKTKSQLTDIYNQANQMPDLTRYERAFNAGNFDLADKIAKKHVGDARFNVHKKFLDQPVEAVEKNFTDIRDLLTVSMKDKLKDIRKGRFKPESIAQEDEIKKEAYEYFTAKYVEPLQNIQKGDLYEAIHSVKSVDDITNPSVRKAAQLLRAMTEDLAEVEGIAPDQIRALYTPDYRLSQIIDDPINNILKTSDLNEAIVDIPHLNPKTRPDSIFSDTTLADVLDFRIKSGIANIFQNIDNKIVIKGKGDDLVEALQKRATEDTPKTVFDKKIQYDFGKIKGKSPLKGGGKMIRAYEAPYETLQQLGIWDVWRDTFKGMTKMEDIVLAWDDMVSKGVDVVPIWTKELGLKEGTEEYDAFIRAVNDTLAKHGGSDEVYHALNRKVGGNIYRGKPLSQVEKWIQTHEIKDSNTRDFINEMLHLTTYGYERDLEGFIASAANNVRRVAQLGDLGMNVSTMMKQPFETRRILAEYGPTTYADAMVKAGKKRVKQMFGQSVDDVASPYEWIKAEDSVKDYYIGSKRVPDSAMGKAWAILEDVGFKGLQEFEDVKDDMFLYATERVGKERGLTGEALENFVFDEFRRYAHKFGSADVSSTMKNPFVKLFMQYQTYATKEVGLNLRKLEAAMQNEGLGKLTAKEARYLYMNIIGMAAEAWFVTKVLGTGMSYAQNFANTFLGGIPSVTGGPVIESAKTVWRGLEDYIQDGDLESASQKALNTELLRKIPMGNQAFMKTGRSVRDMLQGYNPSASGRVRFLSPDDKLDQVRALLFGPFATEEAREYLNRDSKNPLGEVQTEVFKNVYSTDPQKAREYYENIMTTRGKDKRVQDILKNGVKQTNIVATDKGDYVLSTPSGNQYSILDILAQEQSNKEYIGDIKDILVRKGSYKDVPAGEDVTQALLGDVGATPQDIQKAYLQLIDSTLKGTKKAEVISRLIQSGQYSFTDLYKEEVLDSTVAKDLERIGFIQDADALMEKMKMTDSYYIRKEMRKVKKDTMEKLLKNRADLSKQLIKESANQQIDLLRLANKVQNQTPNRLPSVSVPISRSRAGGNVSVPTFSVPKPKSFEL